MGADRPVVHGGPGADQLVDGAVLSPFGYSHLGTSDAAKFIEVSSLAPAIVAGAVTGIIALVGMAVATVFRSATHVSPAL
jgi:hypothetical protein